MEGLGIFWGFLGFTVEGLGIFWVFLEFGVEGLRVDSFRADAGGFRVWGFFASLLSFDWRYGVWGFRVQIFCVFFFGIWGLRFKGKT